MKTFKQYTTEGRKWKAIKSGVKKNWRKKVALALAPGPFTPVALAMIARDIRSGYKDTV